MSRRQRSAREQARRARLAREKSLRRRTRTRRAATAAAAAVTLAGTSAGVSPLAAGAAGSAATSAASAASSLLDCSGVRTPGSSPDNLTDVDGLLFFTAFDAIHGNALWRSDGTAAGTVRLKDLGSTGYDDYGYGDNSLAGVDGTLFFTAEGDNGGEELWRSDGTPTGTVRVKRFPSSGDDDYDEGSGLSNLTAVGDTLFFTADDGIHGEELWRSNGTRTGTVLVKDIRPVDAGGYYEYGPSDLTAVGDTLFFTADDGTHGEELWRSDGTEAGTVLVRDVYPSAYSSAPGRLAAVGDAVYFRARDGVHGGELWRSDGTEAGTVLVKDIRPGARSSSPSDMVAIGDTVYFSADDGTHGRDLWRSDGSDAGTLLVKDLGSGDDDYYGAYHLVAVDGTLFFTASDGTHGMELWRSDGTEAGTVLVKDIRPGEYDGYPTSLTAVGSALYFTARDGVHGRELWRSDGTEAGTVLVEDIHPATDGRPRSLTASGGVLFFAADDRAHGDELWRSDGTEAGTDLVEDINTGGGLFVSSRGDANLEKGSMRVRVAVDGPGTIVLTPAGKRWIKRAEREVTASDGTRTALTLEPTRAARRELRRTGRLEVRARFTFTTCGGAVNSVTRQYTLRMR